MGQIIVATKSAVTLAGTQTLSNKTLASPLITGTVLIGSATAYGRLGQPFEVNAISTNGGMALTNWDAADAGIVLDINSSKNATPGTYTAKSTGSTIGYLTFRGSDGTDFQNSSQIIAKITGTVGADRVSGLLEFHAWSDAASSVDTTVMSMTATTITIGSAITIAGAGTGVNGIVLKNLKNSAASALSGTQLDIAIDIGGTPYYFTVYPTKA